MKFLVGFEESDIHYSYSVQGSESVLVKSSTLTNLVQTEQTKKQSDSLLHNQQKQKVLNLQVNECEQNKLDKYLSSRYKCSAPVL